MLETVWSHLKESVESTQAEVEDLKEQASVTAAKLKITIIINNNFISVTKGM